MRNSFSKSLTPEEYAQIMVALMICAGITAALFVLQWIGWTPLIIITTILVTLSWLAGRAHKGGVHDGAE